MIDFIFLYPFSLRLLTEEASQPACYSFFPSFKSDVTGKGMDRHVYGHEQI
jgi:hypothetical protein